MPNANTWLYPACRCKSISHCRQRHGAKCTHDCMAFLLSSSRQSASSRSWTLSNDFCSVPADVRSISKPSFLARFTKPSCNEFRSRSWTHQASIDWRLVPAQKRLLRKPIGNNLRDGRIGQEHKLVSARREIQLTSSTRDMASLRPSAATSTGRPCASSSNEIRSLLARIAPPLTRFSRNFDARACRQRSLYVCSHEVP